MSIRAQETNGHRLAHLLTLSLVCAFVVFRLALLTSGSLDTDEIFSLELARQPWATLWGDAARDISHPPLFYALLKLWIAAGGQSLAWLRALPFLAAVAALVPLWRLCETLELGLRERQILLAVTALNGFLVYYSVHLRMFSLLQVTSLLSLWLFARWLKETSGGYAAAIALLASNLLLVYSHYWGWVVVACEGLYLVAFARERIQSFALASAVLLLAYLPWAIAVVQAAATRESCTSQIAWINRPAIKAPFVFYGDLVGACPFPRSGVLAMGLVSIPIALWAWSAIRHGELKGTLLFLSWFAVLPVALTFVASVLLPRSVWAARSLIVSVVPYLMVLSISVARLSGVRGGLAQLLLVAWMTTAGALSSRHPQKRDWDRLTAAIAQAEVGARAPVRVFAVEDYVSSPLRFYSRELGVADRLRIETLQPEVIAAVTDERFWVVYRDNPAIRWPPDLTPAHLLAGTRYRTGTTITLGDGDLQLWAVQGRAALPEQQQSVHLRGEP